VPVEPKGGQSKVKAAAVHVKDLSVVERGGSEIVVLETGDGTEYSNFKSKLEAEYEDRDKYVGGDWLIQFTTREKGDRTYRNLIAFEEELADVHGEQEADQGSDRDNSITRQSAAHDASSVVQGMLASNEVHFETSSMEELREDVQEEVEHWTKMFKRHHRTGEWGSDTDE